MYLLENWQVMFEKTPLPAESNNHTFGPPVTTQARSTKGRFIGGTPLSRTQ